MKKFFLALAVLAFTASSISAQDVKAVPQKQAVEMKKHECKDHKDGQACNKPADQQCNDCKAKAAAAPKHECKKAEGKACDKANAEKKDCCKDKMEGKKCDKPADQQCPDCKEKAAKKN